VQSAEQDSRSDGRHLVVSNEAATTPSGLSAFAGRVLDQLSISSWLPAAMLVGNLAVLVELRARRSLSIPGAIGALTSNTFGLLVVSIFGLVLASILTQAFEFEVIRALEGYIEIVRGPLAWLVRVRITRHADKRSALETSVRHARKAAFYLARPAMLPPNAGYTQHQLDVLERAVLEQPIAEDLTEDSRRIRSLPWRSYVDAAVLYRLDVLDARLGMYPQRHRVLATRLGNVLRSAEDRLFVQPGENVEGYVLRHHDAIPSVLREEHREYRTRLEMYTSLFLTFLALALAGPLLLAGFTSWWVPAAVALGYLAMVWIAYEAAVASARGYADVLREVDQRVRAEAATTATD
jgi:hypothetical protein